MSLLVGALYLLHPPAEVVGGAGRMCASSSCPQIPTPHVFSQQVLVRQCPYYGSWPLNSTWWQGLFKNWHATWGFLTCPEKGVTRHGAFLKFGMGLLALLHATLSFLKFDARHIRAPLRAPILALPPAATVQPAYPAPSSLFRLPWVPEWGFIRSLGAPSLTMTLQLPVSDLSQRPRVALGQGTSCQRSKRPIRRLLTGVFLHYHVLLMLHTIL